MCDFIGGLHKHKLEAIHHIKSHNYNATHNVISVCNSSSEIILSCLVLLLGSGFPTPKNHSNEIPMPACEQKTGIY